MGSYIISYDMADIYDSYFVQHQVPILSRLEELKEMVNDLKPETQDTLTRVTGLSPDPDEWDLCVLFITDNRAMGCMLVKRTDNVVTIKETAIAEGAPRGDVFLLMLSRVLRDMELGQTLYERLSIRLERSDLYYYCLEYLGEGTEFING